jgi:hypothetical protein
MSDWDVTDFSLEADTVTWRLVEATGSALRAAGYVGRFMVAMAYAARHPGG